MLRHWLIRTSHEARSRGAAGSRARAALVACLTLLCVLCLPRAGAEPGRDLSILFLGDNGHHVPIERARQIIPVLSLRGIDITYSDRVDDLNPATLAPYDGLIVYANTTEISAEQERSLLDFVAGGKGFIPIHCASYCFLNSPSYVALVGAQFQSHGTGEFRTRIVEPDHPTMRDLWEFETWDETYVHTRHNPERTVLQVRAEGGQDEPWTWTRTHGKGRVFYTAYGHDHRTWGNPAFHALIERGIRWATGDDRVVDNGLPRRVDLEPFAYIEARFPNYLPGRAGSTQAEPLGEMQLPVEPHESMKHMVLPRDFEVRLFAAEPQITKPIAMTWDSRGRLWIAETVDYPNNIQPAGQGHDRIKICEDTDGDGRADRFKVFADKLSIPTSLVFARGGLVVHQAPDTLFLRDTDGDDRADVREVLFSGWSTHDTHAGPSNMHWGFDNWIWGIVGYAGFRGTVGGEEHRFSTGFYRFRPDGSRLEFLRNTNNNSWGVGFSEEGLLFGSTANGNPSVYMPIPNRYYEFVRGWSASRLEQTAISARFYPITEKVRQVDHHGSFTSGAGHALYTARSFPEIYWNRAAFVNGPTGHLLATFLLEPRGSDFVSRNSWNLVASDDEWTAPIMAEVGPDGAVWMIDWYNYIVQHNPTPRGFQTGKGNAYQTPLRDKRHGRIYRIVYTKGRTHRPLRLDDSDPPGLVAALRHENLFWRRTAQRLLVERGETDVVPRLLELASDPAVDTIGLAPGAIHALWTLHGLGMLDGSHPEVTAAAVSALGHRSAGVRRTALQVLPATPEAVDAILDAGSLLDGDAQVRLAAFLALADRPASARAAVAIVRALRDPRNAGDRWIPDAATSAAARNALDFLTASVREGVADSQRVAETIARVAEHFARGAPGDTVSSVVSSLGRAEPPVVEAIVGGLARGWPEDRPPRLGEEEQRGILEAIDRIPGSARGQFIVLAERWKCPGLEEHTSQIVDSLLEEIEDEERPARARLESVRDLVTFRPREADVVEDLVRLIGPRTSPEFAEGLLEALGASESPAVGPSLVGSFRRMTPSLRRSAQTVLLRRRSWTVDLLAAAEEGSADLALLTLDQKQSLVGHPDPEIAVRARKILDRSGELPDADRQAVIEKLLPLTRRPGSPARGKEVFTEFCSKCHVHGELGTQIGPELTGMAALSRAELLTQILDPSRSVEGNFRQYAVVTTTGKVISGMLASETKNAIEIFDADANKHVVLRDEILQLSASRKSMMPEGFEEQMSEEQLVDLLAFLSDRGKYLPLPIGRAATIVSTKGMFHSEDAGAERLIFPDWKPRVFRGVPFHLVDPRGGQRPNVILLHGPRGTFPPRMPRSVRLPCNAAAAAIHMLSGVSGWGSRGGGRETVSMIVRLHYADGQIEDHPLKNAVHFADYIGRFDVPGSVFAFALRNQQIRYLAVRPDRREVIREIEFVKGEDATAPIVMAVTVEAPE